MSKETESLEEQKEKLFEAIAHLQESLDLDDEDVQKIKDWGLGLLVAGISVYVIYKLLNSAFKGTSVDIESKKGHMPKVKMKRNTSISRMIKEQVVVILIAVFRKKIMEFLRENELIDED